MRIDSGDSEIKTLEILKHCPFCGGNARIREVLGSYFVECEKCWAHGASMLGCERTLKEAVAAWNKRVFTTTER